MTGNSSSRALTLWSASLALLVFANCVQNGFVWDDEQFVVKNAYLGSWRLIPKAFTENIVAGAGLKSNLYRPLQTLTHFLDRRLWGLRTSWNVYTSFIYPRVWVSALFAAALLGVIAWNWKKRPLVSAGLSWFLAATLPTSNLIVLVNALFYDHWFILPGLGLCIALVAPAAEFFDRPRKELLFIAALVLASLAATTWHYNSLWKDPIALYGHILAHEPLSAKISNNLGMAYEEKGELQKAAHYYLRAISLSDEYPQVHHNLALVYRRLSREEEALREFEKAVEMDPAFYHSWISMGVLYLNRAQPQQAKSVFEKAIAVYPYASSAYVGLAQAYWMENDDVSARAVLKEGLTILPNDPQLRTLSSNA